MLINHTQTHVLTHPIESNVKNRIDSRDALFTSVVAFFLCCPAIRYLYIWNANRNLCTQFSFIRSYVVLLDHVVHTILQCCCCCCWCRTIQNCCLPEMTLTLRWYKTGAYASAQMTYFKSAHKTHSHTELIIIDFFISTH